MGIIGRPRIPRRPNCCDCRKVFGVEVERSLRCPNRCTKCQGERGRRQAKKWYKAHGGSAGYMERKQKQIEAEVQDGGEQEISRPKRKQPMELVPIGTWCLCLPCGARIERQNQRFDSSHLERLIARADDAESCCLLSAMDAEQIRLALGYIREREEDLRDLQDFSE